MPEYKVLEARMVGDSLEYVVSFTLEELRALLRYIDGMYRDVENEWGNAGPIERDIAAVTALEKLREAERAAN